MRHLLNTHSPRRKQHHRTQSLPALAAFTLVEVMISLVIIGILIVIIFETYITIAKIATRVEIEKTVQTEILHATQVIQNIVDTNALDVGSNSDKLVFKNDKGTTNVNDDVKIEILIDGTNCSLASLTNEQIIERLKDPPCRIKKTEKVGPASATETYLTSPTTHISSLTFTPLINNDSTLSTIYNNGFWLNIDIASKRYNPLNWTTNVRTQQQTFYNSRR